jgi:PTH1 family peptidyl-tRNA hydrolase
MGFVVVERMAKSSFKNSKSGLLAYSWLGSEVELIKPQTFMNKSGEAVGYEVKKLGIELDGVFVIHDDLDLKLGEYKIQKGTGPKVHGGVLSVEKVLKGEDFWRVRIGTDNRSEEMRQIPGDKFVLQKLTVEEKEQLDEVVDKVVNELNKVLEIE